MQQHVLISGASGLIGSALSTHLARLGFVVHALERDNPAARFNYSSASRQVALDHSISLSAVINLAGPSIADGRWTARRKQELLESRVDLTTALATALAAAPQPPALFLSASAVGFYGESTLPLNEEAPAGDDYLASLATRWEAATAPARQVGIPTAHLRFGVVLSTKGGVLGKLMLPFSLCVGGKLGDGHQPMSWIALPDVLNLLTRLIEAPAVLTAHTDSEGVSALNLVADEPITNAVFTKALGRALHRPTPFPLPKPLIRLLFGEMGDALLLGHSAVISTRLAALGYTLQYPSIDLALAYLIEHKA
ncbi:MAG: TIGR01777 family oxidoreductase [Gammaproteobacteria bacterium]|jgi:uncharacterized protein (TIGR01777 family)|nr:TIGR01777 family oxidoreductase [Gammaproteobacteria bacterium]MDP4871471.1 TIGR01777 family oxidoreductase [Gammaproteobacteria bacterium]